MSDTDAVIPVLRAAIEWRDSLGSLMPWDQLGAFNRLRDAVDALPDDVKDRLREYA